MPANNSIYNSNAHDWWQENNFLYLLKTGINPVRFEFFHKIVIQNHIDPTSLKVLDIGCGGGFLSEEFARLGCCVTGLDLSFGSLKTASDHASLEKFEINYLLGSANNLPFPKCSFDIVLCCDVLEHLNSLATALMEASRLLKPGGLFLFDTINRTFKSYFETILIAQELPFTRFFARGAHDWKQFIKPSELKSACELAKLSINITHGFQPSISTFRVALAIIRLKLGRINFATLGSQLKFELCDSKSGSYLGYATKIE